MRQFSYIKVLKDLTCIGRITGSSAYNNSEKFVIEEEGIYKPDYLVVSHREHWGLPSNWRTLADFKYMQR